MLSGVKFISRDQLGKSLDKEREKKRRKKKSMRNDDSDDDLERIEKGSKRKKKWYSSDEDSSSSSSGSEDSYERNEKRSSRKKAKKRSKSGKKRHFSEEYSSSDSEDEDRKDRRKGGKKHVKKGEEDIGSDVSGDGKRVDIARREMGLDWMLRPAQQTKKSPVVVEPDEPPLEEAKKVNSKELNPYFKDNGSGYPDEADEKRKGGDQLPSFSLVGDGGASWRLKSLKRAQEQAAREGRKLEEVVEERWGSLGQLAVSVASSKAAPARAHLHAIRNRQRGSAVSDEPQTPTDDQTERNLDKTTSRSYLKDVSVRHPEMKAPKVLDSLSWGKRKTQNRSREDANLISSAVSSLNKFSNDGSFMSKLLGNEPDSSVVSSQSEKEDIAKSMSTSRQVDEPNEASAVAKQALSANQLAAKALQLRMKGKLEEAEKLLQEAEKMKASQDAGHNSGRPQKTRSTSSHVIQDYSSRKKEEDADRHLAEKIIQSKQYSLSGRADDEYDFEDGPSRKSKKKGRGGDQKVSVNSSVAKRILTQQERCLFCIENPNRPKHLVVSIANFTYLMLPQWQPVVQGHCCILPMQHESSTRTVDNNVWEEIRNFKKCLIMMFAKQDKDLVFLETVMGLAQQRRHCLIECIPLPREIAKQAPLYFKKAIDEAEDEWSQHNAKKLIDTSEKGLRGSIPKDFPYFHVEFGLNRGYVHVIDDEKQFNASLGLNVIRGMLHLPEEDMYRRRRHESIDAQRQAVAKFAQDWEPFDWTKQLD